MAKKTKKSSAQAAPGPVHPWEPWTLVHKGSFDPVIPFDCNPEGGGDEGMLVYRSKAAARMSARHQSNLYDLKVQVVKVSAVIAHEANVAGKTSSNRSKKHDIRTSMSGRVLS